jgi:4-oxalocrotonate tautomerase family enzyme
MLMLKLTVLEGRTVAQKAELIRRLTAAAELYLNERSADIRVIIYEVPPTNWGADGITIEERERGANKH